MKTVHHRTVVFKIWYQLVFCTKCRRKVLVGEVDDYLKTVLLGIASEKGFEIASMETGAYHVHLFVS
jgi:putative transposase